MVAAGRGRWRLLAESWLLLWALRLSLKLLPFTVTRRLAARAARGTARPSQRRARAETVATVPRAVRSAGRYVAGGSNCLTQALAARILLARRGIESELCFGVSTEEEFSAHAWLECDGVTVIGHPGRRKYARLRPTLQEPPLRSATDESLSVEGEG